MISLFIFLFFCLVSIVLIIIEKNRYKTLYTPITLFSVPYIMIIFYQIIITNIYDWDKVTPLFLVTILIYLVNFFFVGYVVITFLSKMKGKSVTSAATNEYEKKTKKNSMLEILCVSSSIFLIIYFIIHMRNLPTFGMVVQENFQNQYSSGINFYLRLMSIIGTVYFGGLASKTNKIYFLLGIICFIPNFLTFVKGITFIMVLGALLSNIIINKRKVKLKLVVQVLLSGIVVFFAIYMIEIGIWNPEKLADKETYQFIYGKLNSYLISGIQSFNININSNVDIYKEATNITIAPLVNVLAKIGITERIDAVTDIWVVLGEIPGYGVSRVNTNTYIGTIALYNGLFGGLILNSIISGILYFLFYSSIRNKNIINVSRYALFSTGIILSWFEYYYMHSFWIYLILIYAVIKILSRYKLTIR